MTRSTFTPLQASKTLPLVRRIVEDVLAHGRELRALQAAGEPAGEAAARAGVLQARLRDLFEELASIGCEYKDFGFEHGLVDFPSTIDGRDVLLCWRSDEERLGWYHTAESGFAGRQPIPAELLEDEGP